MESGAEDVNPDRHRIYVQPIGAKSSQASYGHINLPRFQKD